MSKGLSLLSDPQFEEVLTNVLRRAAVDEEFRQMALSDAGQALSEITNGSLSVSGGISFVEKTESASTPTLVLPLPPYMGDGELDDAQLEAAAGGLGDIIVHLTSCVTESCGGATG